MTLGRTTPVRELHALVQWAEGMVWSSPERHGAMTGLMKTQIDWIPLGALCARRRQDAGRHAGVGRLAVLQRRQPDAGAGALMRMLTIPNQSSVAKAYQEFDEDGRMKPSPYYDRIVDVVEELVKFTLLTRDAAPIWWTATASARKPPPPCRGGCGRRPSELPGTPAGRPEGTRFRPDPPVYPYKCTGLDKAQYLVNPNQ